MTRRTATLLWAAMLVLPFAFLAVTLAIPGDHRAPELAGPVLALAAVVVAANLALARVLPPRLGPARAHDRDAVAFTRVLVSMALCEAAALAPVVGHVITRDARQLALLAVGAAALAAAYPSDRRWGALRPEGHAEPAPQPVGEPLARAREAR